MKRKPIVTIDSSWTRNVYVNKCDGRVQDALHANQLDHSKWHKVTVIVKPEFYENKYDIAGTCDSSLREHSGKVEETPGEMGTSQEVSSSPKVRTKVYRRKEIMSIIDINKKYRYRVCQNPVQILSVNAQYDTEMPVVVLDLKDGSTTWHTSEGKYNHHQDAVESDFDLIEMKPVWSVDCWIDTLHPDKPPNDRLDPILLSNPQPGNVWRYRKATLIEKPEGFNLYQ